MKAFLLSLFFSLQVLGGPSPVIFAGGGDAKLIVPGTLLKQDGSALGGNTFETIDAPAGTDPVADSGNDTLALTSANTQLTITGNSTTDTLEFSVSAADLTLTNLGTTAIDDDFNISKGSAWNLSTNASAGSTQNINIKTGNSSGANSGSIFLSPGTAAGTVGSVYLFGGNMEFGSSGTFSIENSLTMANVNRTTPLGVTAASYLADENASSTATMAVFTAINAGANASGTSKIEMSTGKVNNAGATGNSGAMNISTGPSTATNTSTSTGVLTIKSGTHTGGGVSGEVDIESGACASTTTACGVLTLRSGANSSVGATGSASLKSGDINGNSSSENTGGIVIGSGDFEGTGASGTTGGILINSGYLNGANSTGSTGEYQLLTGSLIEATNTGHSGGGYMLTGDNAGSGNTGEIMIKTGDAAGAGDAGDITIYAGESSTGDGGTLNLWTGSGAGAAGNIIVQTNAFKLEVGSFVANPGAVQDLTADNTEIVITQTSYKRLSSNNGTASNRTFTLPAGDLAGHVLTIEWTDADAGELLDTGNAKLSAAWTPTQDDTISLIYNGTNWIETARSAN